MSLSPKLQQSGNLLLRIGISLIIGFGIVLRLILFFQNRNLIIDEANIVRNLAERDFGGLALPLKYEQYAPPVFLWIEKLASILFGYGEKAMRLFPLLCGIAALFVFYKVAVKLMSKAALLLPLALFAFGNIYIKYSVELKQYMPDTLVGLLLILAALSWDIRSMGRKKFVLLWMLAGSLAIWSSMPSVFILAGIGFYCARPFFRERRLREIGPLILIAAVWLAQFALYFFTILKHQIDSDYLQNYHRGYFLFGTPANADEWLHNWNRIEDILGNVGGFSAVAIVTNLLLLFTGAAFLLWKRTAQFFLVALPVCLVLLAAAFNQFSLIDRVVLFMMPLWMLLIGVGFDFFWRPLLFRVELVRRGAGGDRRRVLRLRGLLVVLAAFIVWSYNGFWLFRDKMGFHEITEGMAWIQARGGRGSQLYVHDANVPTYIYYTELHPDKQHWAPLLGARRLKWDDDYTQLSGSIKDTAYFIYTGGFPEPERARRTEQLETSLRQIDYYEKYICYVFVYLPKTAQDTTVSVGTTPN